MAADEAGATQVGVEGSADRRMTGRMRSLWIMLVLFLCAWVPRVVALDAFVTVDERKWLARSANFLYALAHGDLANTFQREHPGVTVMWAGTLGFLQKFPDYAQQAPGYFTWNDQMIEAWLKANTALTPLELLAAGRWWVVLGVALLLAVSFLPLRRLLGEPLAALALLMIAWMPWSVALSRQLHPDGFVASMIFASLVFFLAWLYGGGRRRDLVISGVLMGLAWLTKTPAAFLVPIGAILIGVEMWRKRRGGKQHGHVGVPTDPHVGVRATQGARGTQDVRATQGARGTQDVRATQGVRGTQDAQMMAGEPRSLLIGYVLWGVVATAAFFLLWPAMWVNPLGSFARMTAEMEEYVGGHVNANFFWGQTTDDPGPFFYPVAYFFRITPATVIGLVAAAVAAARRSAPFDRPLVRRAALGFLLFGLIFVLLMSIPAKKFDRYILPAFPAFEVLAALGWGALALGAGRRWGARGQTSAAPTQAGAQANAPVSAPVSARALRVMAATLFVGVVGLHSLFTALHYPYYLTYFNPLAGGSLSAPWTMIIGWGEGLDQAAAWLNRQPEAEKLRIVSWYHDGPLSYFTEAEPVGVRYGSSLSWLENDFVVLYINQIQRDIPSPEAIDWYLAQEPALTVHFGGLELARIVDMRGRPLPPFVGLNINSAADFGGQIRLLAHELDKTAVEPGEEVFAQLYLRSLAAMQTNYNIGLRLVDASGNEAWRADGWPWGAATSDWPLGEVRPDGRHVALPADAPPGLYKLSMSFYDPETFETLPVLAATDGSLIDAGTRDVALIRVGEAPAAATQFEEPWQFGRWFALSGGSLPATMQAGETLPLALQWESSKATATNYTVFVHIVGADGQPVAQEDRQPLDNFAPTHLWTQGLRVVDEYAIPLPAGLPAGQYEVRAGLYTADGRLPVSRDGQPAGDYAVVGAFEVR